MMGETKALLEKAKRSLNAARVLLASGEPDFAAGRAYYCMLYAAQALMTTGFAEITIPRPASARSTRRT